MAIIIDGKELAKKINTSRSNIANYENDKNIFIIRPEGND